MLDSHKEITQVLSNYIESREITTNYLKQNKTLGSYGKWKKRQFNKCYNKYRSIATISKTSYIKCKVVVNYKYSLRGITKAPYLDAVIMQFFQVNFNKNRCVEEIKTYGYTYYFLSKAVVRTN